MSENLVYVGVGSNLGEKEAFCMAAIGRLDEMDGVIVTKVSSFYRSPPLGDQNQDWYVNAAIEIITDLRPRELLAALHLIEQQLHRTREKRWGARTIDLDILFYNQEVINERDLFIPHRELHKRNFVLQPLLEIAPDLTHPVFKKFIQELFEDLEATSECTRLPTQPLTHAYAGE